MWPGFLRADNFMQVLRTKVSTRTRHRLGRSPLTLKAGSWRPSNLPTEPELRANKRQIAAYLLILTGAVLCTGVLGTYSWMYWKQRALLKQFGSVDAVLAARREDLMRVPGIGAALAERILAGER